MTAYRYRRCPHCHSVFPGGDLKPLRYGRGHYHQKGGSLRRCPKCGYKGFTQGFAIVRMEQALGTNKMLRESQGAEY